MATATCTTKLATLLLASAAVAAEPPTGTGDDQNGPLRIGVVHIDTPTGHRFAAAIVEAFDEAIRRSEQLSDLVTLLPPTA